ncbi:hypothetical protein [Motilibacter aurantiacus]|uniref:hypothetical protein n=1 Tax=Motilibacter aurantiacus TaxID=2714955 RepID=UPI0014085691|nr:hypothetical protein [Motilibacter aurantiacus]NHC47265.1 hypothetical protein [Motilibacter aurantiacus]
MEPKLIYNFAGWIEVRSDDPACIQELHSHADAHGLPTVVETRRGDGFDHLLRVEVAGDDPRVIDAAYAFAQHVDRMVVESC